VSRIDLAVGLLNTLARMDKYQELAAPASL